MVGMPFAMKAGAEAETIEANMVNCEVAEDGV